MSSASFLFTFLNTSLHPPEYSGIPQRELVEGIFWRTSKFLVYNVGLWRKFRIFAPGVEKTS